jgi:hypothetical protein
MLYPHLLHRHNISLHRSHSTPASLKMFTSFDYIDYSKQMPRGPNWLIVIPSIQAQNRTNPRTMKKKTLGLSVMLVTTSTSIQLSYDITLFCLFQSDFQIITCLLNLSDFVSNYHSISLILFHSNFHFTQSLWCCIFHLWDFVPFFHFFSDNTSN